MSALFFTEQPVEALQVDERAVVLNTNDTELLGEFEAQVGQAGDHKRGIALIEQALARNSSYYNGTLAQLEYVDREYEQYSNERHPDKALLFTPQ